MTDHNHKKQDERDSGVNQVVAAVTGAIVGAGVAVAATLALKNEKNRDKVKEAFSNAKDFTKKSIEKLKKRTGFKVRF